MFPNWISQCLSVLTAAVLVLACACAMTLEEQAAVTAGSVDATMAEVQKVSDQIDVTIAELNDLAENPQANLKPQYEELAAAVAALETQAELTKIRADEMRSKGLSYFEAWEQDSDTTVNPELKASYEKIAEESAKARDAFDPFLASLSDVTKLLKMDLSAGGVTAIQDLVKKANPEAQEVKARIQAVIAELDTVSSLIKTSKPSAE